MTDVNTDGARMVAACTRGDESTVRGLLRAAPSLAWQVNVGPLAPLQHAVRESHVGIVQLLLDHGAFAQVVVVQPCRIPLRTVDIATARGIGEVVALVGKAIEGNEVRVGFRNAFAWLSVKSHSFPRGLQPVRWLVRRLMRVSRIPTPVYSRSALRPARSEVDSSKRPKNPRAGANSRAVL
jgi:hypothetical protein